MRLLPLTLPTPAENLALDEALLEEADTAGGEALRLWESPEPLVVLGRSSRAAIEADQQACERRGVPILRRSSGGAAIVAGPGCLMYAVVLSLRQRPELRAVDLAHRFVLGRVVDAIRSLDIPVRRDGTSDITVDGADEGARRKVSGNSLRVKRDGLLYHGTLLYDFDLPLAASLLGTPPRQPDYRAGRGHTEFLANLPADRETLSAALAEAWHAQLEGDAHPREQVAALVRQRYERDAWNFSR